MKKKTLQLLHSEFPYIWGNFDFLFYQCGGTFPLTCALTESFHPSILYCNGWNLCKYTNQNVCLSLGQTVQHIRRNNQPTI